MDSQYRIVIADDHNALREGLAVMLNSQADLSVVGQASDGDEAISKTRELRPDILIIDISMPNCDGIEALQVIKRECPDVHCLVFTMHDDQAFLQATLDAGGLGYVTKGAVKQELIIAVRQVARGRQYINVSTDEGGEIQADQRKQMTLNKKGLSARERQVLSSVARGYSNKQIAEQLGVSTASVEQYRLRLSRKLGAKNRVDLVDYALQSGLLRPRKTS